MASCGVVGVWHARVRPGGRVVCRSTGVGGKGLSLGTWFLVGALSIQIRGTPGDDPRLRELTDGGEVTITGHVTREGYARASGSRYLSRQIDIETESVERGAEVIDVRSGVR